MKEQYQKEISQIHVPAGLLEKTKSAMREEQEKAELPRKGKVIPFKVISIAAAPANISFTERSATENGKSIKFSVPTK